MNLVTIRGAITVDENTETDILSHTQALLLEIEKENNINKDKVLSILFSATEDLNQVYPAKAARELGYIHVSLMCFNEMKVENSLEKCIRVMVMYQSEDSQRDIKHIYLKGAKVLRPDLNR